MSILAVVKYIVFKGIGNKSWSLFCNFRDSHLLLQSGLSEALGGFICLEGVNSVIGRSGPSEAEQKKGLKFIAKRIRKEAV